MGLDLPLRQGDVAFRTNFATRNGSGRVGDRRAGRVKDARELEMVLNKIQLANGVKAHFRAGVEHRGALVLHGRILARRFPPWTSWR